MTRQTKKSVIESGPQAPMGLRADCLATWREMHSEFSPVTAVECQAVIRLAGVAVDLAAAEMLVAASGVIVVGPNGIAYVHPAVKHRDTLAKEFRSLLALLSKGKPRAKPATNSIESILLRARIQQGLAELRKSESIPTGVQQREAAQKQAHFAAEQQRSEL
jgi:phosphopantothenate synthetase